MPDPSKKPSKLRTVFAAAAGFTIMVGGSAIGIIGTATGPVGLIAAMGVAAGSVALGEAVYKKINYGYDGSVN